MNLDMNHLCLSFRLLVKVLSGNQIFMHKCNLLPLEDDFCTLFWNKTFLWTDGQGMNGPKPCCPMHWYVIWPIIQYPDGLPSSGSCQPLWPIFAIKRPNFYTLAKKGLSYGYFLPEIANIMVLESIQFLQWVLVSFWSYLKTCKYPYWWPAS